MPLVLRSVKGSDLTPNEADGNFTFLDGRITTIEGLPLGVGIANITASGTTMTITMTNSSVYTVQLPMADFTTLWAGSWLPSHALYRRADGHGLSANGPVRCAAGPHQRYDLRCRRRIRQAISMPCC